MPDRKSRILMQALRAQQQAAVQTQLQRDKLLEHEPPLHRPLTAPLFGTMPAARAAQLPAAGRPIAQPLVSFDAVVYLTPLLDF